MVSSWFGAGVSYQAMKKYFKQTLKRNVTREIESLSLGQKQVATWPLRGLRSRSIQDLQRTQSRLVISQSFSQSGGWLESLGATFYVTCSRTGALVGVLWVHVIIYPG